MGAPNTWRVLRAGYRVVQPQKVPAKQSSRPLLIHYAAPDDRACKAAGGSIGVTFEIDKAGQPHHIEIIEDQGVGTGAPIQEAVSQWRYQPGTMNGKEESFSARVEMECIATQPVMPDSVARHPDAFVPGHGEMPQHFGPSISTPVPLYKPEPEYSEEARKSRYQGTVVVYTEVDRTGHIQAMRVIRELGLGLDEKALEALSQWRFKPGENNGVPVTVVANIQVNFKLL